MNTAADFWWIPKTNRFGGRRLAKGRTANRALCLFAIPVARAAPRTVDGNPQRVVAKGEFDATNLDTRVPTGAAAGS
jgi:hypothetical protein